MSSPELPKAYDPQAIEATWYEFWLAKKYFHADASSTAAPFSIVIPPPNVTGSLHIGHALNSTLQDILVRWMRMSGKNALWVPGTDHAGIATQNVVERMLAKEDQDRQGLGREKFIQQVWEWKRESGGRIIEQLKKLGASCDWDRERFTMDEGLSRAVREVFVRLSEEGLIYRGERLINWCPRCHTALSDIEVEHEEEKGKLYHIAYPLSHDASIRLTVATTRPETLLGDTAVAVHPLDSRYKDLIGRTVDLPLTDRKIPIVGDSILVDLEFGTGAVKVTPAHDFNDYEAGLRQTPSLPLVTVLNEKAEMLADIPGIDPRVRKQIAGKPAKKARGVIVELLQEKGYLVKTEDHAHAVGKCYRCKTVVEPFLSPQWFVRTGPLAEPAIKAVEDGSIRFIPKGWENTYYDWMRNIKDWCISRQIWWGHRIPAWYCRSCDPGITERPAHGRSGGEGGHPDAGSGNTVTIAITARPIIQREPPRTCPRCGSAEIFQDPDVLDTWFSSALWPFSTLGWPDRTKDLAVYYPTSVLVTSFDIIFFWVARMIMMGLHFMGEKPFRDVYIHALVRDAEGQKMSKSKGNVIDPLEMTERYGTDAFRFTLAAFAAQGRDIKMSAERIEGYRNFANKLWNASRFVMMNLEPGFVPHDAFLSTHSTLADRWITSRMNAVVDELRKALEQYAFNEAASNLYQFIWHEYCDWYLELAKPALNQQDDPELRRATQTTLARVLETTLRMLHPIMPFITEEIWQKLPGELRKGRSRGAEASIMTAEFPVPDPSLSDPVTEQDMQVVMDLILAVRNIRGVMGIPPSVHLEVIVRTESEDMGSHLATNGHYVRTLARVRSLRIGKSETKPKAAATGVIRGAEVYVPLEGVLDLGEERNRLGKEIAKTSQDIEMFSKKLSNPNFVERAPKAVVEKDTARLEELRAVRIKLEESLRMLGE